VAAKQARELKGEQIPAIRAQPQTPDEIDSVRVSYVTNRWKAQDQAYLGYSKTVEENVRMLSGRQWDVWSDLMGKFVDPLRYMDDEERRWRQRPVMDYLGYWFMVTLSKVTENQPMVGFLPSTADDKDAKLAEVMDPIFKTLWDTVEMPERFMEVAAWCLAGGMAYTASRADYSAGEKRQVVGPAVLSLDQPGGAPPITRVADSVPYDEMGEPKAKLIPDPENEGEYGYDTTGDPFEDMSGELRCEVLCPLEVRAQWGNTIPWTEKRWIIQRWFLHPDDVFARWQVQVDPDVYHDDDDESGGAYLERMLFSSGYFGAVRQDPTGSASSINRELREGMVCGYTMWEKPSQLSPQTEQSPGGRLLVVGGGKVLHDSVRPYRTKAAGPIRRIGFLNIPGRPFPSTVLEKMVPLQKRLNRVEAQVAEHTNLVTNPVLMVHSSAGIDTEDFVARPGLVLEHDHPGPGKAAEWLMPPELGDAVWKHKSDVREHIFVIGSLNGNDSAPPSQDPSGELIQQLRYNADRPLSMLTRSLELGAAGVCEDWIAILPTIWTEEQIIAYAGQDNVTRTITVLPDMWDGSVNVRPVMESAAPETREARQARVEKLYTLGAWGPPGTPEAVQKLLEQSRYPELTRAARPGGVHRVMAEHNLGRLVRGEDPTQIPILEVYQLDVHLAVLIDFMASPDYLEMTPEVQQAVAEFKQMLEDAQQAQMVQEIEQEGEKAGVAAATSAAVGQMVAPAVAAAGGGPGGGAPAPASAGPAAGKQAPAGAAA
jgi:hypothetical protein